MEIVVKDTVSSELGVRNAEKKPTHHEGREGEERKGSVEVRMRNVQRRGLEQILRIGPIVRMEASSIA